MITWGDRVRVRVGDALWALMWAYVAALAGLWAWTEGAEWGLSHTVVSERIPPRVVVGETGAWLQGYAAGRAEP